MRTSETSPTHTETKTGTNQPEDPSAASSRGARRGARRASLDEPGASLGREPSPRSGLRWFLPQCRSEAKRSTSAFASSRSLLRRVTRSVKEKANLAAASFSPATRAPDCLIRASGCPPAASCSLSSTSATKTRTNALIMLPETRSRYASRFTAPLAKSIGFM